MNLSDSYSHCEIHILFLDSFELNVVHLQNASKTILKHLFKINLQ